MNNDDNSSPNHTLSNWFATSEDAADVLPSARTSLICRFITNGAEHLSPAALAGLLAEARKREPHLFYEPVYCPGARAEMLKKMTAAQRLEFVAKRGGKK